MRLLYFYGEIEGFDRKQWNPVKVNFSREYDFEPSEGILNSDSTKKTIKVTRSRDYIPLNFWSDKGKIYNSTLFVGKNGSGKTTLLQNLMHAIIGCGEDFIINNLLVWQEKDQINVIVRNHKAKYSSGEKRQFACGACNVMDINKDDGVTIQLEPGNVCNLAWKEHTELIYFSDSFSANDSLDLVNEHYSMESDYSIIDKMLYNLSVVKEINDIITNKNNRYDQENIVRLYWAKKSSEEIEFVFDNSVQEKINKLRKKVKNFKIPVPNKLTIRTVESNYEKEALGYSDILKLRNKVLVIGNVGIREENDIVSWQPEDEKNDRELFKYLIVVESIFRMTKFYTDDNKFMSGCNKLINKYNNKENISPDDRKTIVNALIEVLYNSFLGTMDREKQFEYCVKAIYDLYTFVYDISGSMSEDCIPFDALCGLLEEFIVHIEQHYKFISLSCALKSSALKTKAEKNCLSEFLRKYNDTLQGASRPYLSFDWGLSSGEANMLNMLASLYKHNEYANLNDKNENSNFENTLLLFMDEADIGYHPEWQREWFYIFPRIIEALFSDESNISIQFIMATHSPLLLGDMPSRCSYFIESENQGIKLNNYLKSTSGTEIGTFGQNLYTILKSGFFLENSALGETAIKKSEEIAEAFRLFRIFIYTINNNKEDDENYIDDLKRVKDEINKKNEEKRALFEKDCVPYKTLKYEVEDIKIEYGAYLQYVHSLINLYSGFIKEKLFQEYQYIEWNLLPPDRGKQLELIGAEIKRLNKLKEHIEENGYNKHD